MFSISRKPSRRFPEKPVPDMRRSDFARVECCHSLTLTGMSWMGNSSLWWMGRKNRIGVFADECPREGLVMDRCQWAIRMGALHRCLTGVFFTRAEQEMLRLHLRHGGRAIWIMGRSFPENFNRDCVRAIYENRLLVVSCFWIPRWNFSTYRYCSQMVSMSSGALEFWGLDEKSCCASVYRKAVAYGIPAMLHP